MTTKASVVWSALARETYLETLRRILDKWTVNEAADFDDKVESLISKLKTYRNLCPRSKRRKNLRRCVITEQTSVVYEVKGSMVELIAFFDNRSEHVY